MTTTILGGLINTVLILTVEVGIKIWSVTCDGENTNYAALKEVGCNIFTNKLEDIKKWF